MELRISVALFLGCSGIATGFGALRSFVAVVADARHAASTPLTHVEAAAAASSFVDSIGVNVHNGYSASPYGREPERIAKLVAELGVRHLREETSPGQTKLCGLDRRYAASGVHFDFIVSPGETDAQLRGWQSCSAPAAEAYEGYNEYDLSGDPNWVTALQAAQRQVYAFGSGLGVTVVGPSLTTEKAYASLGTVPADTGNMHDYFSGHSPDSAGWGDKTRFGIYGSPAYFIAVARQTTGPAPMWSTETGYGDAPKGRWSVSALTKMHYELRTLFEHWNAGVRRTYLYELLDEGNGDFDSYGLVDATLAPKPAFVAVAALLRHLAGAGSKAAGVDYSLTAPPAVEHTLLALRPGRFVLALWNDSPEWDPRIAKSVYVDPEPVTLTFRHVPHALSLTTFASSGEPIARALASESSVSFAVDGGVSLLDLTM